MKQQAGNATNGRLIARLAGLGLAGLLFSGTAARAGLTTVAPGASDILAGSAYQPPAGTVVAQNSAPFTVAYQPNGTFVNFGGVTTGQFDQQVVRDPATGQLTFGYNIELDNEGITSASAGSELTLNGFGPFQTAVAGQLQFQPTAGLQRSANGSSLLFFANGTGLGGAPEVSVRTNAGQFDSSGVVTFRLADVFLVDGPSGLELDNVWGSVTFKNAFRPIGPAATGATAVSVPLPPAFYTGIGIMMACGIIGLFRKVMGG